MKPTCLLHTWRPHWQRPFALVLHLHQHQSSHNLHLQYLAKNQSTQRCQSLITQGSDHPPVLEPHMVLRSDRQSLRYAGVDSPVTSVASGRRQVAPIHQARRTAHCAPLAVEATHVAGHATASLRVLMSQV
jgi:hypothetical protein